MAYEFLVQNYGPIARLAPTTPRAQAWLDFHGLKSVMRRADAISDGVRTLPDVLTQLLLADLSGRRGEFQVFDDSVLSPEELH